jgi:phage/plasmid-like protein (TIGR03299 family)
MSSAIADEVVEPYKLTAFTDRSVPWAKLGAVLDGGAVSAAEAAERGGLNFEVDLLPAGFPVEINGRKIWKTVPRQRSVVRRDTNQFFAFVSNTYMPVQFNDAFAFMDSINPNYVAAGTLGGGRQAFMVVELPQLGSFNFKIGGKLDQHQLYVILRSSHDRSKALEVSVMGLRDKCMNALALQSFTRNAQQRWSVRHVGSNPLEKLRAATATLSNAEAYAEEFKREARLLAEIQIEIDDAKDLLRRLLPDRPRRDQTVNSIVAAWQESPTNGFRDNGWGLANAVSEYFEWGRSDGLRTAESRFTSGLNGPTYRYTNRTIQLLMRRR